MSQAPAPRLFSVVSWISVFSLALGTVLIALFVVAKLVLSYEREQGMQTFEMTRSSLAARPRAANVHEPAAPVAPAASSTAARLPEGVLRIPSLDLTVPVYAGTDEMTLSFGAGRVEWTPPLGSPGNVGVAAHRDEAFRPLENIAPGDEILVDLLEETLRYRVVDVHIVNPEDVHVLTQTLSPYLTLITCYPFAFVGSAPQRFIVHAKLAAPQSPAPDRYLLTQL